MSFVSFRNVTKVSAGATVIDGASFDLPLRGKVGLVGENGSGKTTILKLITGTAQPDAGEVSVARSARISYVPQVPDLRSGRTAYEETLAARPSLSEIRQRMLSLERRLSDGAARAGDSATYADAVAEFSDTGGYDFERDVEDALRALGFTDELLDLPVAKLSGGERARVALAKALLAASSVLLLDEPDNHLDMEGIVWLERMLKRHRGAVVLVTHDRELLDRVVDSIIEIEDGKVTHQRGNFSNFLERKRERIELQKRQYLEQQRRVRKLKQAISRIDGQARGIENRTIHFHYRKRALKVARKAVVLKRRVERELHGEKQIDVPHDRRDRIQVDLAPRRWHARSVLWLENVAKAFGDRTLFTGVNLDLSRGQRIALVGPNGTGKTTLMEIALGIQPADEGDVWLSQAASVFYCDQHHAGLEANRSVYDTAAKHTDLSRNQIHYLLAKLLFKGYAVHKDVGQLSGGERTRLVLALLMNTRADLLVLDEPTNHLDLPGIEVLQEALKNFAGAVLFISHDRRLVSAVATDVFELTAGGFVTRRNKQ